MNQQVIDKLKNDNPQIIKDKTNEKINQNNQADIVEIIDKKNKDLSPYVQNKLKKQESQKKFFLESQSHQKQNIYDKCLKYRKKLLEGAESKYVEILMTSATIYALFADDIRTGFCDKDTDDYFFAFTFVCLILFLTEILIFSLCKQGYICSFSFWMDVISTVSLIFDIPWLSNSMFGIQFEGNELDPLKAGRVSRVTARAARLVRFIRLVRLMRVGKLYKHAFDALNQEIAQIAAEQLNEDGNEIDQKEQQQKITNALMKQILHDGPDHLNQPKQIVNHDESQLPLKNDDNINGHNKVIFKQESMESFNIGSGKSNQKKDQVSPDKQKQDANQNIMLKSQDDAIKDSKDQQKIGVPVRKSQRNKTKRGKIQESTYFQNPDAGEIESNHSDESIKDEVKQLNKKKESQPKIDDELVKEGYAESNISKQLSQLTTQRMITVIFSVMVCIPFFTRETFFTDITSWETGLQFMFDLKNQTNITEFSNLTKSFDFIKEDFINYHDITLDGDLSRYKLLRLMILGQDFIYENNTIMELRNSEQKLFPISSADENQTTLGLVIVDDNTDNNLNSILSIIRTLFLVILLAVGAIFFSKDSNELVLQPIERMLIKIKKIAENPLEAARMSEEMAVAEEELNRRLNQKEKQQKMIEKTYETYILESTIIKIGALLALGFGEAGSEIIAKNMNRNGSVDPMISGRKIMAIFGFVAIRNFIDATEILEEGVMVFANEIAEIVHRVCDFYHGAANKNLGDCFLMVWKFKDEKMIRLNDQDEVIIKNQKVVNNYVDQAVLGFLKTMASATKLMLDKKFVNNHVKPIQQKVKEFTIKLGLGLHVGWGIEGSIGSNYKIDASYLSPNVNLASRLEYATKQYGCPILMSGQLYRLFSQQTQKYLRHVDRVTVKGSKQPMDLYTCDMDPKRLLKKQNILELLKGKKKAASLSKKVLRVVERQQKMDRYEKIMKNQIQMYKIFETDQDLLKMRVNYTNEFIDNFHDGLDLYLDGYWDDAKEQFIVAQKIFNEKYYQILKLDEEAIQQQSVQNKNNQQHNPESQQNYNDSKMNVPLANHDHGNDHNDQGEIELKDGPIKTIMNYMKTFNYKAPKNWKGYRALVDK